MKLVEDNRLRLDESIGFYLPSLPEKWHKVTVRQCLNHTSGLPEYFSMDTIKNGFPKDKKAIFKIFANKPFQFETDTNFVYNNTNYLVIAAIAEKISNQPFKQLISETIIDPLKLNNTVYSPARELIPNGVTSYRGNGGAWLIDRGVDWPEYSFAHSGLYSTTHDMANFMTSLVQGEILKAETIAKMWAPITLSNGKRVRWTTGWENQATDKLIQVGHEGGGLVRLSHYYQSDPAQGNLTVVYFTNGNAYEAWTSILVDSVTSIVAAELFPMALMSSELIDLAIDHSNENQLDDYFDKLMKDKRVQVYGVERFVNMTAYGLMFSKGAESGLPLFKLNTRQFSDSPNVWDSLADAWLKQGNSEKAILNYNKALSINPQYANAIYQLKKLNE